MHPDVAGVLRAAGCVFADDEARLLLAAAPDADTLAAMVRERVSGRPLEQILGWAEFCGRRIAVEPGVFVPRRRTEFLVELALRTMPDRTALIVDLCCGSGAVGAVLEAAADVELHATDIDPVAVRCAARNIGTGRVHLGDLYAALPPALAGRIDVIVANAPYVPTGSVATMPPEARLHEPRRALDGGPDGVDVHRRVADQAPRWLAPDGVLLVETSERQAGATAAACRCAGLTAQVEHCADLDATVVAASRPGRARR